MFTGDSRQGGWRETLKTPALHKGMAMGGGRNTFPFILRNEHKKTILFPHIKSKSLPLDAGEATILKSGH